MKYRAGKPRKGPVDDSPRLPQFVHNFISGGAPEGSRNETLHKCAQQYFWGGFPQTDAERDLIPAAVRCGLKEGEAAQAVASAYRSNPGDPIRSAAPGPATHPRPAPAGDDFLRALAAAFYPNEFVAISDAKFDQTTGKWRPDTARIKTRAEWEAHHARVKVCDYIRGEGGGYIAINPLASAEGGRKNTNVAVYRHVLAEFDGGSLEDQRSKLEASGFPISVIVTSGKRSVHGWVRVDAKDKAEWEARRDHVFRTLACDPKNKDLARVSRCPGVDRIVDGKKCRQQLLATKVGPPKWPMGDALPELLTIPKLITVVEAGDGLPDLIEGLLSVRSKMMIAGPSKARKSWTLLDLAISIAAGAPWLGLPCTKGKVILIDGELHKEQILNRILAVSASRMLPVETWHENLKIWPMRGEMRDVTTLMQALMATLMLERPAAVILDPIYKMLGDRDENAASDINSLLNELEQVARHVGCSVLYSHHFAKGDSSDKSPIDRASGSGVWARDPDAMAFFTPPPKPKKDEQKPNYDFQVDLITRGHPPIEPLHVAWTRGHFATTSPLRYNPKKSDTPPQPRDGSWADAVGAILRHMPPLTKAAAVEWLKGQAELSFEDAQKAWEALRQTGKRYVKYDQSTELWYGVETAPF